MESITLGQIGLALTFLVGLITAVRYLKTNLKKWVVDSLKDELKGLDGKINDLKKQIDDVDVENCKNFLVQQLSDAERGVKWDEIELERFYEQYEHYQQKGGNSYIKSKVEKLKAEGKI